jgi:hypothetical protein
MSGLSTVRLRAALKAHPLKRADRLQLNDNPDPYIAVYEPPDGSQVGDMVHIRWKGLVSRPFLRSIFDTISTEYVSNLLLKCLPQPMMLDTALRYPWYLSVATQCFSPP